MPESRMKPVGNFKDYSNCTFRSKLTNQPEGITHMLARALGSIGSDANVLKRWDQPVETKQGIKLEYNVFPHTNDYENHADGVKLKSGDDICCADGAAFILYHSGVCDLGRNRNVFKAETNSTGHYAGCIHSAHYYWPHKGNTDICEHVQEI